MCDENARVPAKDHRQHTLGPSAKYRRGALLFFLRVPTSCLLLYPLLSISRRRTIDLHVTTLQNIEQARNVVEFRNTISMA